MAPTEYVCDGERCNPYVAEAANRLRLQVVRARTVRHRLTVHLFFTVYGEFLGYAYGGAERWLQGYQAGRHSIFLDLQSGSLFKPAGVMTPEGTSP